MCDGAALCVGHGVYAQAHDQDAVGRDQPFPLDLGPGDLGDLEHAPENPVRPGDAAGDGAEGQLEGGLPGVVDDRTLDLLMDHDLVHGQDPRVRQGDLGEHALIELPAADAGQAHLLL